MVLNSSPASPTHSDIDMRQMDRNRNDEQVAPEDAHAEEREQVEALIENAFNRVRTIKTLAGSNRGMCEDLLRDLSVLQQELDEGGDLNEITRKCNSIEGSLMQ